MKSKFWKDLKIDNKIGKGNFGIVYKVIKKDGQTFAVKHVRLPREVQEIEKLLQNGIIKNPIDANNYFDFIIKKEVEIMKYFNGSPYVINYYDFCVESDPNENKIDYYIKMEYAEDITRHFNNKKVDVNEIVKLGIDICYALELCLSNNIIHKDVKPQNIFLGNDGKYKLGDFNVSVRADRDTTHFGTPNYMSPEIYNCQRPTASSDIYSLGIVLYKLISGEIPFKAEGKDEKEVFDLRMAGTAIPVIQGLDDNLMRIILKACSYNVEERYKNPAEMRQDLQALQYIEFTGNLLDFSSSEFEKTIGIYEELLPQDKINGSTSIIIDKIKKNFTNKNTRRAIQLVLLIAIIIFLIRGCMLNRDCKEGYINKNGICVKGHYYCETGYILNDDNKCQKTVKSSKAKVTYTCKSGYTLNGDTCVSNDVKEAKFVYKCADGFTLSGTKCQKTESIDAIVTYSCPNEYVPSGNQCVKVSNTLATVKYICDDSTYTLSNNVCVKDVAQTAKATIKYSCDENGVLSGSKCNYSINPTYNWPYYTATCSKGTYNNEDRKCHYSENAKKSYSCSQGTLDNSGNCKYTQRVTKNATIKYSCPSGYEVVGNQCAKTTGVAPVASYICGDGAQLKDKKCYTTITSDAAGMYACDDGYVPSGTSCYKNDFPDAIKKYRCSRIYTLNGNKCEKYKIIDAKAHYD